MNMNAKRVSIVFSEEAYEDLLRITRKRKSDMTKTLRVLLGIGKRVFDGVCEGKKVILSDEKNPDDSMELIVSLKDEPL